MPSSFRTVTLSAAIGTLCALVATLAVLAVSRPSILLAAPSASSSATTFDPGVMTSGSALVSKRPDLAVVWVGVESKHSRTAAGQQRLANEAVKLIGCAKAVGMRDSDINTW